MDKNNLTYCYLIADEVGLGKTKSAKAVIFERILDKQPIHCIYVASSVDLANQNMEEFVAENGISNSYDGLVRFQKKNAETVLQKMFDSEYSSNTPNNTLRRLKRLVFNDNVKRAEFRLSLFRKTMINEQDSFIMQLSPKTSFARKTDEYVGSEKERDLFITEIGTVCTYITKKIANEENGKNDAFKEDAFKEEVIKATWYLMNDENHNKPVNEKEVRNYLKKKQELNAVDFHDCRWIFSNTSAALYRPNLIILDEFQRYRNILCQDDGYSIKKMIDYLKWRFPDDNKAIRVLLLSATPYKMDRDRVRVDWSYAKDRNNPFMHFELKDETIDNPYEDVRALLKEMKQLGTIEKEKYHVEDILVRTERNKEADNAVMCLQSDKNLTIKHQKYINSLLGVCLNNKLGIHNDEGFKRDYKTVCIQAGINPGFWRFNAGYDKYAVISDDSKKFLLSQKNTEKEVFNNLSLRTLIDDTLRYNDLKYKKEEDEYELPQLWVPPVKDGKTGRGKTIVFTSMTVTTRCVAFYYDQFVKNILSKYNNVFESNSFDIKILLEKLGEQLDIAGFDGISKGALKSYVTKLEDVLKRFFERDFVRHVISANNYRLEWGESDYSSAILRYCDHYHFYDMIIEWFMLNYDRNKGNIEKVFEGIKRAFQHLPADIKEYRLNGDDLELDYATIDYAEMFVCDDGKTGKDDVKLVSTKHRVVDSVNEICDHFNSPLYPMVLVARSSAQEGFNLQYYGDKIMHWQCAASVEAFLQREGRLDRPFSLTMRHKVWRWAQEFTNATNALEYKDAWKLVSGKCKDEKSEIYSLSNMNKEAGTDGLVPLWVLDLPDSISEEEKNKYRIKQILAVNEYDESLLDFAKEVMSASRYSEGLK